MRKRRDTVFAGRTAFTILRVYGERKNGYLYLVTDGKKMYMMKEYEDGAQMAAKAEASYKMLEGLGILMPKLIMADKKRGITVKEYVEGKTAAVHLQRGDLEDTYLDQLRKMAQRVENTGCCLDYFPTHFVCRDNRLYYVHFESLQRDGENCLDACIGKYWLNGAGREEAPD